MNKEDQIFIQFTEALYATDDIDQMFLALEKAAIGLGFDTISYTFVPGLINRLFSEVSPVFQISRDYNKQFIEHYSQASFAEHDFTIKRITAGVAQPINWWQVAATEPLHQAEKNIIEVARADYGIRHGITLPAFSDGYNMAGVSVTSEEKDGRFALLCSRSLPYLQRMSRMYNDRILAQPALRSHFVTPFLNTLSDTEKSVLLGLCQGQNLKSIAVDLQLDYKYLANFVMSGLRKKFGNLPRDQMLFEAGLLQLYLQ